jgi:hypothetical protein
MSASLQPGGSAALAKGRAAKKNIVANSANFNRFSAGRQADTPKFGFEGMKFEQVMVSNGSEEPN